MQVPALPDFPPLPERGHGIARLMPIRPAGHYSNPPDDYNADDMRAYAREYAMKERLAERERCAVIAQDMDYGMGEVAAAIRAQGVPI